MEERKLTEKESLEVITSMISRTKERYMMGDGNIMLMWGYLILTVTALIWILIATTHNQQWNWLWFAIWIGGIITPIMSRKKQIKSGVKSYSDKIMSRIWLTVGFSGLATTLMCLGFLLILSLDTWNTMFTFALTIVPFAEIAQGIVIHIRRRDRNASWHIHHLLHIGQCDALCQLVFADVHDRNHLHDGHSRTHSQR